MKTTHSSLSGISTARPIRSGTPHEQLVARAKVITARELLRYSDRTAGSQLASQRARRVMPMGVASSFQNYDPHPIVVRNARGAYMEDVDGHRYIDFSMGLVPCLQVTPIPSCVVRWKHS